MPFIQKQTVPLSFTSGLQSKTDALQLQPPALLSLKNARFDKIGALNKRPGYDILSTDVIADGQITSAVAIDSFNQELNLFDNQNIYTYIATNGTWANRGPAISLINTNENIIRTVGAQQLNPDYASVNNVNFFIWEDSRGGCRYSVLDADTSSYIVADRLVPGAKNSPKAIVFNNLIYIFYVSNNNLYYRTIDTDNPNTLSGQINLVSDGYSDALRYDICVANNRLYINYMSYAGSQSNLYAMYLDILNVPSAKTQVATGTLAIDSDENLCCNIYGDNSSQVWINWSTGSIVFSTCYDQDLASVILPRTLIDTVLCPTIASIEYAVGSIELVYEVKGSTSSNQLTKAIVIQNTGAIQSIGTLRSVGLASKPFQYGGNIFVNLAHQSTLQSTYFTVLLTNAPFTIVGKISPQVGGGLRTNGELPEMVESSPGVFSWANLVKGIFISEANTSFSLLGVNATTSDFTNINKFNSVTFSNNLLFVGGILQTYDGVAVVEQNFHLFPEDIVAIPSGFDGALSAGQYQYQVVYAWTDNFGQVQYSAPSSAITVTTLVNNHVTLIVPTLRLTAKTGVVIKIYRTQVNGTLFQEVTSELAPLLNNPLVDSVTFVDVAADTFIASNQIIYTTGGVVPNAAPPSCSMISLFQDRVIIGGLEDRNILWFSKSKSNNSNFNTIPVEFSPFFTIGVNSLGGPITALGLMDQNLIIFKENCIFIMNGDGPNDAGGGNGFPEPQVITQSVGCTNPNSIILTGQGIMFQTPDKGIWMLDRSLGPPQYIGAGVDDEARQHLVSSATLDPNSNSVIFTTFTGPALIYDYLIGQWSTWTNHNAVDSSVFNSDFIFVKSNGTVYQQNQNIFYDGYVGDNEVFYAMEITTPWISYSRTLGYQSIFRTFILGEYKGPHDLKVEIGYNFNPSFTKSALVDATASNTWGSDGYWGESTPWGGEWTPYIFQINMPVQKCTSFRLKIYDVQTQPYNEGLTANSLLFELGSLPDGVRIPATKKFAGA